MQPAPEPRPLGSGQEGDRRGEQNYREHAHMNRITWTP
jgi:hypothetical protein